MAKKAVFFDRDGVLNRLILNPATGAFEAPQRLEDLKVTENLPGLLKPLQDAGYALFVVSNQPDAAKGKASLDSLKAIHAELDRHLKAGGILFTEYYYCYHHPQGIVPELSGRCQCRKPSPYFIKKALADYQLDAAASWMLGDLDTDMACGKAAGVKTLLIGAAQNLRDAIEVILAA